MADDEELLRITSDVDEIGAGFDAFDRFRMEITGALRREIRTQTWQLVPAMIGALTAFALFMVIAVLVVRTA